MNPPQRSTHAPAPRQPARRYGSEVVNELVRIRKQLKADGWDYGPRTIYYEAALQETFPSQKVPSVATIARLFSAVGQVDAAPRKRPKSSYIPFTRAAAMALWQLDAFEYQLATGTVVTVYQLLDDATRYDVGTWAHTRHENSADAQRVLERAIDQYGAPQELLSDNSLAFNQLGRDGLVRWRYSWLPAAPCRSQVGRVSRPHRGKTNGRTKHWCVSSTHIDRPI
jgi:transposase InsO family protein